MAKKKQEFEVLEIINEDRAVQFIEQAHYKRVLTLTRVQVVEDNLRALNPQAGPYRVTRKVKLNIEADGKPHEVFIVTVAETPEAYDEEGHFLGRDFSTRCYLESSEKGLLSSMDKSRTEFLEGLPNISADYYASLNVKEEVGDEE